MSAAFARMRRGDYVADIAYEESSRLFRGRVINAGREGLDFWRSTIEELRAGSARSVQVHEQTCRDGGREPKRPIDIVTPPPETRWLP